MKRQSLSVGRSKAPLGRSLFWMLYCFSIAATSSSSSSPPPPPDRRAIPPPPQPPPQSVSMHANFTAAGRKTPAARPLDRPYDAAPRERRPPAARPCGDGSAAERPERTGCLIARTPGTSSVGLGTVNALAVLAQSTPASASTAVCIGISREWPLEGGHFGKSILKDSQPVENWAPSSSPSLPLPLTVA